MSDILSQDTYYTENKHKFLQLFKPVTMLTEDTVSSIDEKSFLNENADNYKFDPKKHKKRGRDRFCSEGVTAMVRVMH